MTTDANSSTSTSTPAFDTRGGNHFLIGGERIHESDLTAAQRHLVGLPPLPIPEKEPNGPDDGTYPGPATDAPAADAQVDDAEVTTNEQ